MSSTFLGLFVTGIAILGLIVTAYILFVITLTKQVNTVNGILLVQLAIVEFVLSLLYLICNMPSIINELSSNEDRSMDEIRDKCTTCGILFSLLRPVSVWTVCGLNCDRYYAISCPLHYGSLINQRRTITAICFFWILSIFLCLLPFLYPAPYNYNYLLVTCIPDFTYDLISACYTGFFFIVIFFIPLILMLTCNIKIFLIARYQKHRIASAIFEVTLSAQVTITHQRNLFKPLVWANKFKGRNALFSVLQLVGAFFLLYVPYYSATVLESLNSSPFVQQEIYSTPQTPRSLITTASVLLVCSSTVNGLLYGVKSKILRKSFQNYWRKKMSKNEVQQEIQARTPSTCGSRRPSLTPLGFFSRQQSATNRRPSEASIDLQKSNILGGVQRCLNEISFRPATSSPGLGILASRNNSFTELKRTRSYRVAGGSSNTTYSAGSMVNIKNQFRCSANNNDESPQLLLLQSSSNENTPERKPNIGSGNMFVQRLRKNSNGYNKLKDKRRRKIRTAPRSPRILITRAFSEENEYKSNNPRSPPPPKTSSSVSTLLVDNSWRVGSEERISFSYENEQQKGSDPMSGDSNEGSSCEELNSTNDERLELYRRTSNDEQKKQITIITNNSANSWPSSNKTKKDIKFHIGSVICLSESQFGATNLNVTDSCRSSNFV